MLIPEQRLSDLVLEALRRDFGSQWLGLTQSVAWVATERGIYPALHDTRIVQLDPTDEPQLHRYVSKLLEDGLLALGIEGSENRQWPWLSLTSLGREAVFGLDAPGSGD